MVKKGKDMEIESEEEEDSRNTTVRQREGEREKDRRMDKKRKLRGRGRFLQMLKMVLFTKCVCQQGKKKVEILSGKDGNDWVWVMGHHSDDISIEDILEREAREKATLQAEREGEELRIKEEEELKKKMDEEKKKLEKERIEREFQLRRKEDEAALYQSLKQVRLIAERLEQEREKERQGEEEKLKELQNEEEKGLQHCRDNSLKLKSCRSAEIYMTWRKMRNILEKSNIDDKEIEATWKEQEKKSREAEVQMRDIVRRAREEHRRSLKSMSNSSSSSLSEDLPPIPPKTHINNATNNLGSSDKPPGGEKSPTPKNRNAVIKWFKEEERPKEVGLNPETKKVEEWFHGLISRAEAERILSDRPIGSFLVRVSERIWGYTVSYQSEERCKHFLIDASDGAYHFFGTNYQSFNSLQEILNYHMKTAITVTGQELLLFPCGQKSLPPNFAELFYDEVTDTLK